MEENDNSKKYKVAGAVVATLLVILAVIVSFLGNIKITKKPKVTNTVQKEVSQNSDTSSNKSKADEQSNGVSEEKETLSSSESARPIEESSSNVGNSSSDVLLRLVKNEGKLDYSGNTVTTTGTVDDKKCYLQDNQIVYLLDLEISAGISSLSIKYYCPYDTYMSVDVNDLVTVNYKQVSESAFAVMSVTK